MVVEMLTCSGRFTDICSSGVVRKIEGVRIELIQIDINMDAWAMHSYTLTRQVKAIAW